MSETKKSSSKHSADGHRGETPDAELLSIRKKLKHFTTESKVKYWLDTGDPYLNSIFGSEEKGIPYGKIFELAGWESCGKTFLCQKLIALAQRDGASAGWMDLENSYDEDWAKTLGVDTEKLALFSMEMGRFGKEKEERLITAEEQLAEMEEWIKLRRSKDPNGRMIVVVDSIPGMLPEEEGAVGIQEQNMRTKIALAPLLSKLMKRWIALARSANVIMLFINQLRVSPMAFGNPEYTPGGNAIRMFASVRVRMRKKSKKIIRNGKPAGIKGTLVNFKNKAGGGSRENLRCGYKLYYKGKMKYVDESEIKSEGEE